MAPMNRKRILIIGKSAEEPPKGRTVIDLVRMVKGKASVKNDLRFAW
jgi:hypothetical protein